MDLVNEFATLISSLKPIEIILHILSFLDDVELINCSTVCKQWHRFWYLFFILFLTRIKFERNGTVASDLRTKKIHPFLG
jgi:hypothetical protein